MASQSPNPSPREIRTAAGRTQIAVAVAAGVSLPCLRLYEASPDRVRPWTRKRLDAVYATMRRPVDGPPSPPEAA